MTTWGSALSSWEELMLTASELIAWGKEAQAALEVLSSQELPVWEAEVLAAWGLALPAQRLIRETA